MLPLSFSEFLYFHDFEVKEVKSAFGGVHKRVFDKNGDPYELREAFEAFMRFGWMPGIADIGLNQETMKRSCCRLNQVWRTHMRGASPKT